MPLRRILGLSAAVSGRLRRGFSSSASHPAWAMMQPLAELANSTAPRASLRFAEPPCLSRLIVPTHLVHPPSREPRGDEEALMYGGGPKTSSGDGLLLLAFMDISVTAPLVATHGGTRERKLTCVDVRRFVCNPVSGQMFRLPDIDGTMETLCLTEMGILTQSERPDRPPDRYAVAVLSEDRDGEEGSFVMRRFLSQTGQWEKLVGLPSPLPLARRMNIDVVVLASAGRLWWVDVSWGVVSSDPFADQPDLRFIELPGGSVTDDTPQIGAVDPLNASVVHLTVAKHAFSVDMDRKKMLACSVGGEGTGLPCVLPPWLGSSQIPSAGSSTKTDAKNKTLSDVLVRVDRYKKK